MTPEPTPEPVVDWTDDMVREAYAEGRHEQIVEARKAGHLDHLLASE